MRIKNFSKCVGFNGSIKPIVSSQVKSIFSNKVNNGSEKLAMTLGLLACVGASRLTSEAKERKNPDGSIVRGFYEDGKIKRALIKQKTGNQIHKKQMEFIYDDNGRWLGTVFSDSKEGVKVIQGEYQGTVLKNYLKKSFQTDLWHIYDAETNKMLDINESAKHEFHPKVVSAEIEVKREKLEKIFKRVKCFKDKNGKMLTLRDILKKYLTSINIGNQMMFHGTSFESAKQIQKNGIKNSKMSSELGNFKGAYFSTDRNIAGSYTWLACSKNVPYGEDAKILDKYIQALLLAHMPSGSRLGVFKNQDDYISKNLLKEIFNSDNMKKALEKAKLTRGDMVEYIQSILIKMGYDGVLTFDHTGETPVIFNKSKIVYDGVEELGIAKGYEYLFKKNQVL